MITLPAPIDPPPKITHAKIVAIKMEDNIEHWIKAWATYGYQVGGEFVEWREPTSGNIAQPVEIHFEDGVHPLAPGRALFVCPDCGRFSETADPCPCEGRPAPYDAFSRLVGTAPGDRQTCCVGMICGIYQLATTDRVPDLITGEPRTIIPGEFTP